MSEDLNIPAAAIEILKYSAGAFVIYKFSRWLFTSETSNGTSELSEQISDMRLCQDKSEISHNEHLKQIIEIQKKYLNIQQIEISNKQRDQERVNKELGQLKDSMQQLKLQQTEEFKKNQTLFATKFEQVKTELKNNNQQVSELKNQQKQLLHQLQNQKKKPKKEALESKIDYLNGDFKEQKQAFDRCDLHITSVCSEIQNSVKNLTKQQGFLQNLVLDLKSAMKEQVQTEEDSSDKCVFCFDKVLNVALNPCGHVIACTDCEKKLPKNCPICRNVISNTLRIYFP